MKDVQAIKKQNTDYEIRMSYSVSNMNKRDLWTNQKTTEIESENFWAKLRVKCDNDGNQYYDVLIGEKHKDPHAHIGYTLVGNEIFRVTKDQIRSLERQVESQMHGKYPSEKLVLKQNPERCTTRFSIISNDSTRESIVKIFELKEI